MNIGSILKNYFLAPFLILSGFDITLYCQDLQSLHKENQSQKGDDTFPFLSRGLKLFPVTTAWQLLFI